jgi:N6-L-threonylcarbamoyladenine synthase
MKILSIETSCDETAISIVEASGDIPNAQFTVLANITFSQAKLHAKYGGVFPSLAKREHSKNLVPILLQALEDAGMSKNTSEKIKLDIKKLEAFLWREPEMSKQFLEFIPKIEKPDIDVIAVTKGPGLEPALWVGVNFAKVLSIAWNVPVVPVNHMEGHIFAALLQEVKSQKFNIKNIEFPAIALLISGGHTELVFIKKWMDYEVVGQTRDDAIGEAFDKVARMLELPYPGGPEISKLAEKASPTENPPFPLPRPMIGTDNLDFSFSGLKTAVLYTIKKLPQLTQHTKEAIALEFEEAVTEILFKKTLRAVEKYGAKTIIIGGGVSANKRIRHTFKIATKKINLNLFIPDNSLSTDNALMIAIAGYFRFLPENKQITHTEDMNAEGNLML